VTRPVDAVLEYLRAQHTRGLSHVHLDPEARAGLRALQELIRSGGQPVPAPATPQPVVRDQAPEAVGTPPPPTRTTAAPRPAGVTRLTITGSTLEEKLASVREAAENWAPARSLGTLRETMVFATGDPTSRLMLVGEAPGHDEEKKREPFVGPAGQKLDLILKAMGFPRPQVYISNIVKFRPATARQATNNRPPTPDEINACLPLIEAEIDLIRPACIIALGGTAATGLLASTQPVAALRGSWHDFRGIPVRVTYHPSYLLRSEQDVSTKRKVWEDMLAVMERLELPISEKQRGYFR
jgi:uracil-DNA glycosylase family 4